MAGKLGCGPMAVLMFIVLVIIGLITNEGVGFFFTHCDDDEFFDCVMELMEEEEEEQEGTVVATGVYTYKDYAVTVTANIPLAGGTVTGTVSGTCEGSWKGTYSGSNNRVISAKMAGVCAPFFINIPASAQFTGTVNKTGKTVPLSFTGKGGGLTHEGAMTLTYK